MKELIEYINTLELVVSQEMFDRHNLEWETTKKNYSGGKPIGRANLDSEYFEDAMCEDLPEVEAITEEPDKYYADTRYANMIIDWKEIASSFHYLQHDTIYYLNLLEKGKVTHFGYFKSNRLRYEKNRPDIIPIGYKLRFEFLGIYDVRSVLSKIDYTYTNSGRVNIYNLRENYDR